MYCKLSFALMVFMGCAGDIFTRLREVVISVDLEGEAIRLGLNHRSMKNQILVLLKRKLPRLQVSDKINTTLFGVTIILNSTQRGSGTYYFGSIAAIAAREVIITDTAENTVTIVWTESFVIGASSNKIRSGVREALDELTTAFAAQWYRDNPAK